MMLNLNEGLHVLDWASDYQFIDTERPPPIARMRAFSPKLLWTGTEIFGLPEPTPPFKHQSRAYENGVPSAATLGLDCANCVEPVDSAQLNALKKHLA